MYPSGPPIMTAVRPPEIPPGFVPTSFLSTPPAWKNKPMSQLQASTSANKKGSLTPYDLAQGSNSFNDFDWYGPKLRLTHHGQPDEADVSTSDNSDSDSYYTAEEDENHLEGRDEWEWDYSKTPPASASPGASSPHFGSVNLSGSVSDHGPDDEAEDSPTSPTQHPFWRRKHLKGEPKTESKF
ncbi:hypothetical protein PQX77_018340 [Marasmius sp. AFHP31]|nr:hypothetical protein PQX77_018340 [Marasmius sp. AFHP31]